VSPRIAENISAGLIIRNSVIQCSQMKYQIGLPESPSATLCVILKQSGGLICMLYNPEYLMDRGASKGLAGAVGGAVSSGANKGESLSL
jgi:hypothetical protein